MMPTKKLILIAAVFFMFAPNAVMAQDPFGDLRVIVKDFYDDTPVVGAQVLITPCNDIGTTDSNGEYLFTSVTPSRSYQVDVEATGFISRSVGFVTVEADQEAVAQVPLKQESTISGQVTDGSLPLAGVVVILGTIEGTPPSEYLVASQAVTTDGSGEYTLENVDEGSYKIATLADDYVRDMVDIEAEAGQTHTHNVTLTSGGSSSATADIVLRSSFSGDPLPLPTYKGKRAYFDMRGSTGAEEIYWLKEEVPPNSVPMGQEYYLAQSQVYSFIIPATGSYVVKLLITDSSGVVASESISFDAANIAPEAVPSVIPGPSEIPYIYNDQVYPSTSGSTHVAAGESVYLRGFAIDQTLLSPEEFNPDAPCFDIYENKNGNFSASLFDYSWTLKDKNNTDLTYLLSPSASSENVTFDVPGGTPAGDYFVASLTVTDDELATSDPTEVTIMVAEPVNEVTCGLASECHSGPDDPTASYPSTQHAQVQDGATCQDCHGPSSEHNNDPDNNSLSLSYWPGVCGQCHIEFAELQKANHSDPLPFGYYEPSEGRLTSCYKCHFTPGYIGAVEQQDKPFYQFSYPSETLAEIPRDTPNVSCSVCHDPHVATIDNPYGLRTGSAGTACDTCHYEKWHNAILEGRAGEFENGYHYPGEDYTPFSGENNPHRTEDKCVHCHMDETLNVTDANDVLKIGGHTMRMRDYGDDQVPETGDDILNLAACQNADCHPGLTDFNHEGKQTEIKGLLANLGDLLKGENHGFLPGFQPGKCARCHKGGTVPFLEDSNNVLENAYTNYKLVLNDRSWGIHNPGYVEKLLQDSINSVLCEGNFDCDEDVDGTDAATFKADFGRSMFFDPCSNENQCHGDFDCDVDVDGTDAALFKSDFGRSIFSNPCRPCEGGDWCSYP
jgi:hypothetical protein